MIDSCISNIIQSRINYVKVMSKYVGKRVFFFFFFIRLVQRRIRAWFYKGKKWHLLLDLCWTWGPQNYLLPCALWNKQTKHGQQKIVIICVNKGEKEICRNDLTHPQNFYKLFAFIHLPPSFVPPRNLTSTMMGSQFIKPCSTKNGVQFDDPTCWTYVSSLSPLRAYLEQRFRFLNPMPPCTSLFFIKG